MDSRLKQRLVGAAVLVALAVIFLPMLVQGPAPDSGVSDVPLSMPDAPRGDYETRDLPLVTPGAAPDGGAVGMHAPPAATSTAPPADADAAPAVATPLPQTDAPAAQPLAPDHEMPAKATTQPQPLPAATGPLPATTAAGDYAVSFGSYGTTAAADAVIASLRASQLPARRESITVNGKPAWRVRIGPYASRAVAETARLAAAHVRADVDARVVALDTGTSATAGTSSTPAAATVSTTTPTAAKPSVAPAPVAAKPAASSATGYTIQLAAYSQAAEATALRDKLRAAGFTAFTEAVSTDKGTLTRVRVGPALTRAEADQLKAQIKAKVGLDGVVRPYP
jgi:cell division septation protein DedD